MMKSSIFCTSLVILVNILIISIIMLLVTNGNKMTSDVLAVVFDHAMTTSKHTDDINIGQYTKCSDLAPFPDYLSKLQYETHLNIDALLHNLSLLIFGKTTKPSIHDSEMYINLLSPYATCLDEDIVVNENPFKLSSTEISDLCDSAKPYFNGRRDDNKLAYIVDIVAYAYEVGLFEIRLKESYDLITNYIVWEDMYSHRLIKKPLYFESSYHKRFKSLDPKQKIIHYVGDDQKHYAMYKNQGNDQLEGDDWRNEGAWRRNAWHRYLESFNGNNHTEQLHSMVQSYNKAKSMDITIDDVYVIISDLDEIASYKTMLMLRYCKPNPDVLQFPIHFDPDQVTFARAVFDYLIRETVTFTIFEAPKVPNIDDNSDIKTYPYSGVFQVIHVTPGLNPFQAALKDLLLAESGTLSTNANLINNNYPWKGQEELRQLYQYTNSKEDSIRFLNDLYRNPGIAYFWMRNGMRSCCGLDSNRRKRNDKDPILWFAFCNKQRFPYLFPSYCKIENIQQHPLRYKCKDDNMMDIKTRCQYSVSRR